MALEETLLDPPITPAPLFVYRAFQGWWAGSPDSNSSPTRDQNKENTSPIRHKSMSRDIKQKTNAQPLSPQKRKLDNMILTSPTKSILRTPGGAPTPRAKNLRDVNVKFKSLSPEVRRKLTAAMSQMGSEIDGLNTREQKTTTRADERKAVEDPDPEQQIAVVEVEPLADADLEDHFRRTEKEMKRLIRYGQKWRDVARRQDEENAKLRVLLEEAQKESRRLDAKLRRAGIDVEGATKAGTKQGKVAVRESVAVATGMRKNASNRPRYQPNSAAQDIEDLLDLTPPGRANAAPTHRSISAPVPPPTAAATTSHPPRSKHQPSDPKPHPSITSRHPPPATLPQRSASTSTQSPLTALQHRIEGSMLPLPSTAARTNLPEDRIAEVRKRLMMKRQAKMAGISVLGGVGGPRSQERDFAGGKEREKGDESGVDWLGV